MYEDLKKSYKPIDVPLFGASSGWLNDSKYL